jgi:hypothetical protein
MILAAGISVLVCVALSITLCYIRYLHVTLMSTCSVSRAHLTCDPGNKNYGYNTILTIVKFTEKLHPRAFRERFLVSLKNGGTSFSQRMRFLAGCMFWEKMGADWSPSDQFEIRSSLTDECQILDSLADRLQKPIRLDRPCWDVVFFENVHSEDSKELKSVFVLRYHHAIADGFTMIKNMINTMKPVKSNRSLSSLFPRAKSITSNFPGFSCRGMGGIMSSLQHLLFKKPDRPSVFRASNGRKSDEPLSLQLSATLTVDRVKDLASSASSKLGAHVSVNDIMTTLFSIALRQHAIRSGWNHPVDLSSVMWVSLAKSLDLDSQKPLKWDNTNLGFGYCKLPISESSPMEVLRKCYEDLCNLKSSPDALVINWALRLIGSLPVYLGKLVSQATADTASVSMSNLPGPSAPVHWPVGRDGDTYGSGIIKEVYFATSPPFHFGPLISIISYNGRFYITMSARSSLLSNQDLNSILNEDLTTALESLERSL